MVELRGLGFVGVLLFGAQVVLGRLTLGSSFGLALSGLAVGITGLVLTRRRSTGHRPMVRALVGAYAMLVLVMLVLLALTLKWLYLLSVV